MLASLSFGRVYMREARLSPRSLSLSLAVCVCVCVRVKGPPHTIACTVVLYMRSRVAPVMRGSSGTKVPRSHFRVRMVAEQSVD